ncbi:hypothetical protein D3C71_1949490 [compost metagenome]
MILPLLTKVDRLAILPPIRAWGTSSPIFSVPFALMVNVPPPAKSAVPEPRFSTPAPPPVPPPTTSRDPLPNDRVEFSSTVTVPLPPWPPAM